MDGRCKHLLYLPVQRSVTRSLQTGDLIVAPPLLPSELTNTIWQRIRRRDVTQQEGEQGLSVQLLTSSRTNRRLA
jgi:hypothetical protein